MIDTSKVYTETGEAVADAGDSRYPLVGEFYEGVFKVLNVRGLHARAAAKVVGISQHYAGEDNHETYAWNLAEESRVVDASSIMGLMTLEGTRGSEIGVRSTSRECLGDMEKLFENGFGESVVPQL